jgi:hypothetical protein
MPWSFWQRAELHDALRARAIGALFSLLRQHAGASQTQICIACSMSQGTVSQIIRDVTQLESLAVQEPSRRQNTLGERRNGARWSVALALGLRQSEAFEFRRSYVSARRSR